MPVLRLIRLPNCLMTMAAVWVGAALLPCPLGWYGPAVVGLAAFGVCGAGNALNDLIDLEGDRINHPSRPLVRGSLSRPTALKVSIGLGLAALAVAAAVNVESFLLVAAAVGLVAAYNLKLKRVPVVGNLTIALLTGLAVLSGGVSVAPSETLRLPGPLIGALLAGGIHFVREIVKNVLDLPGDIAQEIRTLPAVVGVRKSLTLALAAFVAFAGLSMWPVWQGWYGVSYQVIVLYIIDLPLLGILVAAWFRPERIVLNAAAGALKLAMAIGLVALIMS